MNPEPSNRIYNWALMGLIFLAPFVFLSRIYDYADQPKRAVIQVGVAALTLFWLMRDYKSFHVRASKLYLPVFCFLAWAGLTLAWAPNGYEVYETWIHWSACALMFVLVRNCGVEPERILVVVFCAGTLMAMLGLAQHMLGFSLVPQVNPPAGCFANKNMAGHFVISIMPLGVAAVVSSRKFHVQCVVALAVGAMIAYIRFTQSRAAIIAVMVQAIFLGWMLWPRRKLFQMKDVVMVCFVGIVLCGLLLGLESEKDYKPLWEKVSATTAKTEDGAAKWGRAASIAVRLAMWANTGAMIKDRPLRGWGLGQHKIIYPAYHNTVLEDPVFNEGSQPDRAHNDYAQLGAELGIPGLMLVGWMYWYAVGMMRGLCEVRETEFFAIGISAGMVGLLVLAMFSFPFQQAIPPFLVGIYAGVIGLMIDDCRLSIEGRGK